MGIHACAADNPAAGRPDRAGLKVAQASITTDAVILQSSLIEATTVGNPALTITRALWKLIGVTNLDQAGGSGEAFREDKQRKWLINAALKMLLVSLVFQLIASDSLAR